MNRALERSCFLLAVLCTANVAAATFWAPHWLVLVLVLMLATQLSFNALAYRELFKQNKAYPTK